MADLKALLAILGSRCVALWVHLRGDKAKQALFPRITMNTLKGIPIARSWMESRASLSTMVDRILAAKQQDARADVSELEEEIDELVYALYGLTKEEKTFVQSDSTDVQ